MTGGFRLLLYSDWKGVACPYVVLVTEGEGREDLVEVLLGHPWIQSSRILLQVFQNRPLHKLKHQVPAASIPPGVQQRYQVIMAKTLTQYTQYMSIYRHLINILY